jgi:polyisoprenoid-binding protein YceI
MNASVSCSDLKHNIDTGSVVVIDVLTPEDYAVCHIACAQNACVYEMAFLDRIVECAPDRAAALVVYDATGSTRAAEEAREKLVGVGYRSVSVLSGGLRSWTAAGYPVEGTNPQGIAAVSLNDGRYTIDTEKSRLEWIGRNLNNRHNGRIAIAEGEIVLLNGLPFEGRIVLDMTSITDLDLQDDSWRDLLVRHLKSEDFFEVARFPVAKFELYRWELHSRDITGLYCGTVYGSLTIKDVTRPIQFLADISPQEDGSIKAHAALDIDRTLWNVRYGSGRLFERLGMHWVHDRISLELFISAISHK